jgi:Uma2 family endonuclease
MTLDEFLSWEERQEQRFEYDGADIRAMTGGSMAHARIQANLICALGTRLRGGPCFVVGSEIKIRTATSIRYPDAMVICASPSPRDTDTSEPVVVFEILSPSSARNDLGGKNAEYQTLASLRRYVVLHQGLAAAEVFDRREDGEWGYEFLTAEHAFGMPEIGIDVPIQEIYEGVELVG